MSCCRIARNLVTVLFSLVPVLSLGQTVQDDPGITVSPGANVVYRPPLRYPDRKLSGTVMVDATLDPDGHVTGAQALSGPDGLRSAAVENVLQSRYLPGAARVSVSVNFLTYRIGGGALLRKLKSKDPEYPAAAKANRVQGTVRLSFTVAIDGTVKDVEAVSGDPLLTQAAVDAVRQWVYAPARLNDVPAEVMTGTSINFTLPDGPQPN